MINWSKYFDRIYCINFSQYTERKQLMQFQLNRVGILNSGIFEWQITYSGPFEKLYLQMLEEGNNNNQDLTLARVSTILGHLQAIKKAYYNNYERVLIIEDDERFLKDLDELQKKLDNLPSKDEYDLVLLDKFCFTYSQYRQLKNNKSNFINKDYAKFEKCVSAGCYVLNRTGMEVLISIYDSGNFNITDLFFPYDLLAPYWNKACAVDNLAVQVIFQNITSLQDNNKNITQEEFNKKVLEFQLYYKYQQIRFDNYMMRKDGSPYYYGDYIKMGEQ